MVKRNGDDIHGRFHIVNLHALMNILHGLAGILHNTERLGVDVGGFYAVDLLFESDDLALEGDKTGFVELLALESGLSNCGFER